MAFDKTNTGILGANKRKEKDSHPDITSSINVDGKDYWLSGWKKANDNGTFYSLAVKPKDGAAPSATPQRKSAGGAKMDFSDLNGDPDDLPF